MSKSNVFENDFLKLVFHGTAIANLASNAASSPLTTLYVALHTADPGEAGTQSTSEASYTNYARVAVARSSAGWAVTNNAVKPVAAIVFPTGGAGAASGNATYCSIGTASTGAGKILWSGPLSPPIGLGNGITPQLTTASAVVEDPPADPVVYPTAVIPSSQYAEISTTQPTYLQSVPFGSTDVNVRRITNSLARHSYATRSVWNADATKMLLAFETPIHILNASDYSIIDSAFAPGFFPNFWDPVNSNILWGTTSGSNGIRRYDFGSSSITQSFTFTGYTEVNIGEGEGSISNDGRYIALRGTPTGGGAVHVIVYDTVLNAVHGTIVLSGWTLGGSGLDNCHISPSGNYVVIASYKSGDEGHIVYARSNLTTRLYKYETFPGHMDMGYRTDGTEVMVRNGGDSSIVSVRLSDGVARTEIPAAASSWSMHMSCRNILRPGYAYFSAFYNSQQTTKYLWREICAIKLDGTGTIERFGQHMMGTQEIYDCMAMAVPNPDGSKVCFASGWGTTTRRTYVSGVGA